MGFSAPTFLNPLHRATKAGCTHLYLSTHWTECRSVADFCSLLVCLSLAKLFLCGVAREHTQKHDTCQTIHHACPWSMLRVSMDAFLIGCTNPSAVRFSSTTQIIHTNFSLNFIYILLNSH